MVNSKEFAKRLEKIITHYGLNATAFSEALEFNRSTISHLLSGRNKPSLEFVMKVLEEFPDVELYWLLNGKGSFPSEKNAPSTSSVSETTIKPKTASTSPELSTTKTGTTRKEIEKVIIFYTDGSFKTYDN
jgi:transcriptional regulator with XRE-family HTH domain